MKNIIFTLTMLITIASCSSAKYTSVRHGHLSRKACITYSEVSHHYKRNNPGHIMHPYQ